MRVGIWGVWCGVGHAISGNVGDILFRFCDSVNRRGRKKIKRVEISTYVLAEIFLKHLLVRLDGVTLRPRGRQQLYGL